MRLLTVLLFIVAGVILSMTAQGAFYEPPEYHPPPISWLEDEEGMDIAPRVTFEPKP